MNIDEPTLDALSKLLDKYHLSELTYQTGDQKITLKKRPRHRSPRQLAHRLPSRRPASPGAAPRSQWYHDRRPDR
ncbi:hypothetical protein ACW18W_10105, partial [Limosilactobacillus fermentum]